MLLILVYRNRGHIIFSGLIFYLFNCIPRLQPNQYTLISYSQLFILELKISVLTIINTPAKNFHISFQIFNLYLLGVFWLYTDDSFV